MPPAAVKVNQAQVLAAIEKRHRACGGIQWGIIVVGIPLTFIGPLLMTMIIWIAAGLFGYWWPWLTTFGIVTAVFVPILFWYATYGSASMLSDSVRDGKLPPGAIALSRAGGVMGSVAILASRPAAAGFQEIFLTGPRQIVKAMRKIRILRGLKNARHDRAAEIFVALLAQQRGVEVAKLVRPPERETDIYDELALLMFHDWIGMSEDGQRAWALSDARKSLGLDVPR